MDEDARQDLLSGWKLLAAFLIYPLTITAGLNALLRILSGCCVTLDSWSPEGALGNFVLGFPALASLAALWLSTIHHASAIARDRARFVLVTTGLMTGILMELSFLRSSFVHAGPRFPSPELYDVWRFGGPLLIAPANLLLLIRAREQLFASKPAATEVLLRDRSTPPQGPGEPVLQPVILRPFPGANVPRSKAG